jgi:hypothetical protein
MVSDGDSFYNEIMQIEHALDFLDRSSTEPDVSVLVDRFVSTIASFGFECCAGGAWAGSGAARIHRFYFNTWPQDWLAEYEANDYIADDPMLIETRRRMTPFVFSRVGDSRSFTIEGAKVLAAARAYGWMEVMAVPNTKR